MSHRHNICLRPDVDGVKRQGRELLHASGHAELVVACCALCYLSLDSRFLIDGMSSCKGFAYTPPAGLAQPFGMQESC